MDFCDSKCCFGPEPCSSPKQFQINQADYHKVCEVHFSQTQGKTFLTCGYCNSIMILSMFCKYCGNPSISDPNLEACLACCYKYCVICRSFKETCYLEECQKIICADCYRKCPCCQRICMICLKHSDDIDLFSCHHQRCKNCSQFECWQCLQTPCSKCSSFPCYSRDKESKFVCQLCFDSSNTRVSSESNSPQHLNRESEPVNQKLIDFNQGPGEEFKNIADDSCHLDEKSNNLDEQFQHLGEKSNNSDENSKCLEEQPKHLDEQSKHFDEKSNIEELQHLGGESKSMNNEPNLLKNESNHFPEKSVNVVEFHPADQPTEAKLENNENLSDLEKRIRNQIKQKNKNKIHEDWKKTYWIKHNRAGYFSKISDSLFHKFQDLKQIFEIVNDDQKLRSFESLEFITEMVKSKKIDGYKEMIEKEFGQSKSLNCFGISSKAFNSELYSDSPLSLGICTFCKSKKLLFKKEMSEQSFVMGCIECWLAINIYEPEDLRYCSICQKIEISLPNQSSKNEILYSFGCCSRNQEYFKITISERKKGPIN